MMKCIEKNKINVGAGPSACPDFTQGKQRGLPLQKELPEGWSVATISGLVGKQGVFVDGDWVESKDQDPNGDVRLIQLADIGDGVYRDKSQRFLTQKKATELGCTFLKKGDVLVARMPDPLGRACIFPGDVKKSVTVVDVAIVRPKDGDFDTRWLMYFINAPVFRNTVASMESGSTRKRISRKNLSKIHLPVPPFPVQTLIVSEIEKQFSRLDEAVTALKRIKGNLKRYKASVLKAAVEGRLTEEWRKQNPDIEPAEKLLERILAERKKKWEEKNPGKKYKEPATPDTSNLPELPEGWVWANVGQLYDIVGGGTPSTSVPQYWDGDIPWITSADIYGVKDIRPRRQITEEAVKSSATNLVPQESLIVVTRVGLGKIAITKTPLCFSQDSQALVGNNSLLSPSYSLYYLFNAVQRFKYEHRGTTIAGVTKKQLADLEFAIPSLQEQKQIVEEIESRLSVAEEIEAAVETNLKRAERMRQAILKKAFEGKLI